MLHLLKKFFKVLLPLTINRFDKKMNVIQNLVNENKHNINIIDKEIKNNKQEIKKLKNEIIELNKLIKENNDVIKKFLMEIGDLTKRNNIDVIKNTNEIIWANIFNNTISNSKWLKDKSCSPGRWAVGYPCLYVIYRVLNDVKPRSILELGLGQSTRLMVQYAKYSNAEHFVVEHDKNWINFFLNDVEISKSKVIQLDREMVPYKEAEAVRVFKGFKSKFQDNKFDFIFIDAPLGGDMKKYSRIDVLSILPSCLENNFIILIDDYNRIGEKNTLKEIERILKDNNIAYRKGIYSGQKDCVVICSEELSFISTM